MIKKKSDNNIKSLLIVGGVLIILGLFGLVMYKSVYQKKAEVMTVKFGDSENQVEVNQNGEVTIRTPFGVYKQTWDKEKLAKFLARLNELDFEGLGEFLGEGLAIELTFGNGTNLRVEYSEELSDIVDELQEELENVYKDEDEDIDFETSETDYYFKSSREQGYDLEIIRDEEDSNTDGNNDDSDESGGIDEQEDGVSDDPWTTSTSDQTKDLECNEIDPKTGKAVIISNTVCGR